MGIVESAKAVRWARQRQPEDVAYGVADISDPARVGEVGEQISDRKHKAMAIVSADPATHMRQLKAMRAMGATAVVVMNVSGADPLGTLRMYGEHVLPELRS